MLSLLNNIPTEVLTGFVSAFGGVMTTLSSYKAEREKMKIKIEAARSKAAIDQADAAASRGGAAVRRTLAIMAACYLFVWPVVFAACGMFVPVPGEPGIIQREVPVVYVSNEEGGFWIFKSAKVSQVSINGFAITPVQSHLAAAVFFFYFGAGATSMLRKK